MKKVLLVLLVVAVAAIGTIGFASCAHKHSFAEDWTHDATGHWHAATCDHAEEKDGFAAHVDANSDHKCDVCGYDIPYAPAAPVISLEGDVISWSAVAGATSYEVLKDGAVVSTVTTLSYTVPGDAGTFVYTVVAVGSGNLKSAASNAVTVVKIASPVPSLEENVLSWPAVEGATKYDVYEDGELVKANSTALSYTIVKSAPGKYSYTVVAKNDDGVKSEPSAAVEYSYIVALSAPNVIAADEFYSAVQWAAVENADHYVVHIYVDGEEQEPIEVVGQLSYKIIDDTMDPASYKITVTAVANGEYYKDSAESAPVEFTIVPQSERPQLPTPTLTFHDDIDYENSNRNVYLDWSDYPKVGVAFTVTYYDGTNVLSDSRYDENRYATRYYMMWDGITYAWKDGTEIRVRASATGAVLRFYRNSETATYSYTETDPPKKYLDDVTNVKLVGNVISWDPVHKGGTYCVYVRVNTYPENQYDVAASDVQGTSYTIEDKWLTGYKVENGERIPTYSYYEPGKVYTFGIKARPATDDNAFWGLSRNFVETVDYSVEAHQLDAPELSLNENVLSWNKVEFADKYKIYEFGNLVKTVTDLSYTIVKAVAGNYNYTVSAVSNNVFYSESEKSNEVVYGYGLNSPLDAPVLKISVDDSGAHLTWDAVANANEYTVWEAFGSGSAGPDGTRVYDYKRLAITSNNFYNVSHKLIGSYHYVVRSVGDLKDYFLSPYSNAVEYNVVSSGNDCEYTVKLQIGEGVSLGQLTLQLYVQMGTNNLSPIPNQVKTVSASTSEVVFKNAPNGKFVVKISAGLDDKPVFASSAYVDPDNPENTIYVYANNTEHIEKLGKKKTFFISSTQLSDKAIEDGLNLKKIIFVAEEEGDYVLETATASNLSMLVTMNDSFAIMDTTQAINKYNFHAKYGEMFVIVCDCHTQGTYDISVRKAKENEHDTLKILDHKTPADTEYNFLTSERTSYLVSPEKNTTYTFSFYGSISASQAIVTIMVQGKEYYFNTSNTVLNITIEAGKDVEIVVICEMNDTSGDEFRGVGFTVWEADK